jgi:hypothetical protein
MMGRCDGIPCFDKAHGDLTGSGHGESAVGCRMCSLAENLHPQTSDLSSNFMHITLNLDL